MANPQMLNRIIWFSVKGREEMPPADRLPAFDAMRLGLAGADGQVARAGKHRDID